MTKERYNEAHKAWFQEQYPNAWKDGLYSPPPMPSVAKANGLTKYITNFLFWKGHHAERTNTMGTPVKKTYEKFDIFSNKLVKIDNGITWRKSNTTKGSSDIKGHIKSKKTKYPIPFYIEVKINKDTMSDDQIKYQNQINKTGAFYFIVKNVDDFLRCYDYLMELD